MILIESGNEKRPSVALVGSVGLSLHGAFPTGDFGGVEKN